MIRMDFERKLSLKTHKMNECVKLCGDFNINKINNSFVFRGKMELCGTFFLYIDNHILFITTTFAVTVKFFMTY